MKNLVVRLAGLIAGLLGRLQLALLVRRPPTAGYLVLDIDNTLADTWPSLVPGAVTDGNRLAGLAELAGMRARTADLASGRRVLYVSHRFLWQLPVTLSWLRAHGFPASLGTVLLVPEPPHKLRYLRRLVAAGPVEYWDDLSHGHEHGTVQYYEDLIAAVRSLPIDYRGAAEIAATVEAATEPAGAADGSPPGAEDGS